MRVLLLAGVLLAFLGVTLIEAEITFFKNENGTKELFFDTNQNRDFLNNETGHYNMTGAFIMPIWAPRTSRHCKVLTFFPSIKRIIASAGYIPPLVIYNPLLHAITAGCLYHSYSMSAIDDAIENLWDLPELPSNSSFTVSAHDQAPIDSVKDFEKMLPSSFLTEIPSRHLGISSERLHARQLNNETKAIINKETDPYPYHSQKIVCIAVSPQRSTRLDFGGFYGELYGFGATNSIKKQVNRILWTLIPLDVSERLGLALAAAKNNSGRGLTRTPLVTVISTPNPWNVAQYSAWNKTILIFIAIAYFLTVIYAVVELFRILRANPKFNQRVLIYLLSIFYLSISGVLILTSWMDVPYQAFHTLYWLTLPAASVAYSALLLKWADTVKRVPDLSAKAFRRPETPISALPTSATLEIKPSIFRKCKRKLRRLFRLTRKVFLRLIISEKLYKSVAILVPLLFMATGVVILVGILAWSGDDATYAQMVRKANWLKVGVMMIRYVWPVIFLLQAILFYYYGYKIMSNLSMVRNHNNRSAIRRMTILTFLSSAGWFLAVVTTVLLTVELVGRRVPGYFFIMILKLVNCWILFGSIILALGVRTSRRVGTVSSLISATASPTSRKSPFSPASKLTKGKSTMVKFVPRIDTCKRDASDDTLNVISTPLTSTTLVEHSLGTFSSPTNVASVEGLPEPVDTACAKRDTQDSGRRTRNLGLSIFTDLAVTEKSNQSEESAILSAFPTPMLTKVLDRVNQKFEKQDK